MAAAENTISESKILEIAKSLVGKNSLHPNELDQIIKDYFSTEKDSLLTKEVEERLARYNPLESDDPLMQLTLRMGMVSHLARSINISLDYKGVEIPSYGGTLLKKHTKVVIRPDSQFHTQIDEIGPKKIGILLEDFTGNPLEYKKVTFENGYNNQYRFIDLEPADRGKMLEDIISKNKQLADTVMETSFSQFSEDSARQLVEIFTDDELTTRPRGRLEFLIGDKIRMGSDADKHYSYSKEGSEGEVIGLLPENMLRVEFTKFTGPKSPPPPYECKVSSEYAVLVDGPANVKLHNFRIGDRIRMNKGADKSYKHSKSGSEGVITARGKEPGSYIVQFTKITGLEKKEPQLWEISQLYMDKLNPLVSLGMKGTPQAVASKLVKEATERVISDTREQQRDSVTKQVEEDVNHALIEGLGLFSKENDFYVINQQRLVELLSKKIYEDNKTRPIGNKLVSSKRKEGTEPASAQQRKGCDTILLLDIDKYNPTAISAARDAAISGLYLSKQQAGSGYGVINLNEGGESVCLDNLLIENLSGAYGSTTAFKKAVRMLENKEVKNRLLYLVTDCASENWNLCYGMPEQMGETGLELSEEGIQLVVLAINKSTSKDMADALKNMAKQANGDFYQLLDAQQMAPTLITSYINKNKKAAPSTGAK